MTTLIHQLAFIQICSLSYLSNAADIDYLRTTLEQKFGENRHHLVNPTYKDSAKEFIHQEFKKFGLETLYQDFQESYSHPDLKGRTFTNVVGVWKGANFGTVQDKIVGVGAHYDTVKGTSGVDDNGAGVAAMLETANMLTSQYRNPQNTVIFVAFDIEEYMFKTNGIGSYHFVNEWLFPWLQKNYGNSYDKIEPHGMIVLDTIMNYDSAEYSQVIPGNNEAMFTQIFPKAYVSIKSDQLRGDFLTVIYRAPTHDLHLARSLKDAWTSNGRHELEIEMFGIPSADVDKHDSNFHDFVRSDHYHFWSAGLPAIFLTDSANFRGDMVDCYHQACDNVTTIVTDENVRFLAKTTDSLTTTLVKLSSALEVEGNGTMQVSAPIYLMLILLLVSFV